MATYDSFSQFLNPKKWWITLSVIFLISFTGVFLIARHTYTDAPPIPNYKAENGKVVFSVDDILEGQAVFQQYALMDYGSMFGDGGYRGPDYTAEALHTITRYMQEFYKNHTAGNNDPETAEFSIQQKVITDLKANNYEAASNTVQLNPAEAYAALKLADYYVKDFSGSKDNGIHNGRYISDDNKVRQLAAFFYWGAWVSSSVRPGENYSYTHNWPYDPEAGNTPTRAVIYWSFLGSLGLILGLGLVLYYHGKLERIEQATQVVGEHKFMDTKQVAGFVPTAIQKATYKYFVLAMLLFCLQVLSGILTVHDFVGFTRFFGVNLSEIIPVTISRSWHVQLSLLWISVCWIGASFFMMSLVHPEQKPGQLKWINGIFYLLILLSLGAFSGIYIGPVLKIENWYWLGHQGWEYVELGKVWQAVLAMIFVFWAIVIYRGVRPVLKIKQPWALPNWLLYAILSIIVLFISGFIATPKTNFVIADFWRWMVVHMWAEAFFEVFTTVLIGYFMVMMGLVSKQATIRIIYLATLLFLGSGLLGISHNFYWNAKPVGTMALGAIFSTLQVIPLVLLTLEAWRFSRLPQKLEAEKGGSLKFGFEGVFLFLLGINFWNFLGAGVFGFIINLPIANYFEHGTYLTVNHGHAALMGVYGNLALATIIFCSKLLIQADFWKPRLIKTIFWSINAGLFLMVILDLFPAGLHQLEAVLDQGLWYARSSEFIDSAPFQRLTWMRIFGGAIFTLGGLIPLTVFIVRRMKNLKKSA